MSAHHGDYSLWEWALVYLGFAMSVWGRIFWQILIGVWRIFNALAEVLVSWLPGPTVRRLAPPPAKLMGEK